MHENFLTEYRHLKNKILAAIHATDFSDHDFNLLAYEIFLFQKKHNTPYATYCTSLDTNDTPTDWQTIPPVPTDAFKSKTHPITCLPTAMRQKVFRTSGTTSQHRGEHWFADTTLYDASILAGWQSANLPIGLPALTLTQTPTNAKNSSLVHMFDTLGQKICANHNYFIAADGELLIDKLTHHIATACTNQQPVLILGTALTYLHLFEQSPPLKLPTGSYLLETGGYKNSQRHLDKQDLYQQIEHFFGLPDDHIINEYSMTELSTQAYAIGRHGHHHWPHWARLRLLDPHTNQPASPDNPGCIAICDLANLASTLCILTQDLATKPNHNQHQFHLIGRHPSAIDRGCSLTAEELFQKKT